MPGELAAEERPDEPRVASVRSNGAAAARDAGGVPDAPELLELKIALLVLSGPNFTDA